MEDVEREREREEEEALSESVCAFLMNICTALQVCTCFCRHAKYLGMGDLCIQQVDIWKSIYILTRVTVPLSSFEMCVRECI